MYYCVQACPAIGICPIPPDTEVELTVVEIEKPVETVGDILPTCALCTFTITKLVDLIGKNTSKVIIHLHLH